MADGNLTLEEFWKLSKEEKLARCGALSDHDAYRLRMTEQIGVVSPPCNRCIHRFKDRPACKAFPDGVSGDHIRAVMADMTIECGVGYRFEEEPDDAD